jgi:iron complex transport system ATP-binding protein
MTLSCRDVVVELDGTNVVDGVSIDVPKGDWLMIVGPNGAGKTTLLRAIAGLASARGMIEVDGRPLSKLHARARAQVIAFVPQTPVIPIGTSVFDYVLLGRTPHISYLGTESAADLEAAAEALEFLDLGRFSSRALESLSGGELQRVLLARAIAQHAPIVLLDEPNTSLDIGHQQDVLDLIDRLRRQRGLTVVSTMHDLTLAGLYAHRLVLLDHGRIVADGDASVVLTEAHLERYYGARVRVIQEGAGFVVVPQRRSEETQ